MDATKYGMLWTGTDVLAAIKHFQMKYGDGEVAPDFVRANVKPDSLPETVLFIEDPKCNSCLLLGVQDLTLATTIYPRGFIT